MSGFSTANIYTKNNLGNTLFAVEINATTGALVTPVDGTNAMHFGHLTNSNLNQTESTTDLENEKGDITQTSSTYKTMTTATLQQQDKALLDFMDIQTKNRVFLEGKKLGVLNGNIVWQFATVKIKSQSQHDTSNIANTPYESTMITFATAITYTATDFTTIESVIGVAIDPTTATIPANQGKVRVNTAVA